MPFGPIGPCRTRHIHPVSLGREFRRLAREVPWTAEKALASLMIFQGCREADWTEHRRKSTCWTCVCVACFWYVSRAEGTWWNCGRISVWLRRMVYRMLFLEIETRDPVF